MDIFEALATRRSIRKYTDEPISEADLGAILAAGMMGHSAMNEQPWQFVVVRDPQNLVAVSHASPYTHMAARARAAIIVCGDLRLEKVKGFWVQDCSAAIMNILLAARGKNIGSVWCGIHPHEDREEAVRKQLNLPEHVIPLGLICLGHPDQPFHEEDRYKAERVHYEKW